MPYPPTRYINAPVADIGHRASERILLRRRYTSRRPRT